MFFLIGPAFVAAAVALTVWPTKRLPAYPDRKVRDWWVVGGLFAGGIVAHRLFVRALGVVIDVAPQARALSLAGGSSALASGSRGAERTLYIACLAVLAWQLWRETVELPRASAASGAPYAARVLWRDVGGLAVACVAMYVMAFGVPGLRRGRAADDDDDDD